MAENIAYILVYDGIEYQPALILQYNGIEYVPVIWDENKQGSTLTRLTHKKLLRLKALTI